MKDYLGQEISVGNFVVIVGTASAYSYTKDVLIVQKINEKKLTLQRNSKVYEKVNVSPENVLIIDKQLESITDKDVLGQVKDLRQVELDHSDVKLKAKSARFVIVKFRNSNQPYCYTYEMGICNDFIVVKCSNREEFNKIVREYREKFLLINSSLVVYSDKTGKFHNTISTSYRESTVSKKRLKEIEEENPTCTFKVIE